MTKITYLDHNGASRTVDGIDGESLMETAVSNLVPGIDGDCGGACACATCHVQVEPDWLDKLPPVGPTEKSMLEFCEGADETSRLGCQIDVGPALDGLVVRTPVAQH